MTAPTRVLFVDDDAELLAAIRSRLGRKRAAWSLRFATSGAEALELLAQEPCEVIISDMRMPEMDGAELLSRVRDAFPSTLRIVLTAYSDLRSIGRSVTVTHQFLTKPCDGDELENLLDRACRLQQLLGAEDLRNAVGGIDTLPSPPWVYQRLVALLAGGDVGATQIAEVIQEDPGATAKLLQLVNSSFFRRAQSITSVDRAVSHLGVQLVKSVVLSVALENMVRIPEALVRMGVLEVYSRAPSVARVASELARGRCDRDHAFTAGLLHEIGTLVLAWRLPEIYRQVYDAAKTRRQPMHLIEREMFRTTDAELGAFLLGLWGLPMEVMEAVANQHHPGRSGVKRFTEADAVYYAVALIAQLREGSSEQLEQRESMERLEELDLVDELEGWRERARVLLASGA